MIKNIENSSRYSYTEKKGLKTVMYRCRPLSKNKKLILLRQFKLTLYD